MLLEQGLLAEPDVAVLGSYCMAVAGYLECIRLIEEQGAVITVESTTRTGRTSKPIKNPAVALMFEYQRAMMTSAAKFGFTPYDRERIEGSEVSDDDDDPFEQFLQDTDRQAPAKPKKLASIDAVTGAGVHGDALGPFIKFPEGPKFDAIRHTVEEMTSEEFAEFRDDYYESASLCVFGLDSNGQLIAPHGTSVYGVPKLRPEDD